MSESQVIFLVCGLVGYLLGSIPFGLVLTRMAGLGDIRKIGSGNIGATNVLRTGHKGLALLTLLCDSCKAAVAALVAFYLIDEEISGLASLIAGTMGVIGHNFPIWLKFKGGKGVAATLGMLFATSWEVGLASGITWLVVAFTFKYSSLSALVALTLAPVYALYIPNVDPMNSYFYGFLAVLAIIRHHQNITRLLNGTETKIGQKKKSV
ncbi:MAG: glycerol-3-phosphate 1-O-acyltransferase PlsY [Alphaproteobacteria bacterium]|nr:glycerol-3-phosphate 1-O-acyltransferase PlsY [Alphaproteobacteria bacterium]